jgi:hypothetical protein
MKLQLILSSAALAAALSFSAPALAQLALPVPGDQEQAVRDACAALFAASTASTIEQDLNQGEMDETETGSVSGEPESGQSTPADPASREYWDVVIAGLSLEDCRAMGL